MLYRRFNFVDEFKQCVAEKRAVPFAIFKMTTNCAPDVIAAAEPFTVEPVPPGYEDDDTPVPRRKKRKKRARRNDSLKFLRTLYALEDPRK